jgi:hypothetical protein
MIYPPRMQSIGPLTGAPIDCPAANAMRNSTDTNSVVKTTPFIIFHQLQLAPWYRATRVPLVHSRAPTARGSAGARLSSIAVRIFSRELIHPHWSVAHLLSMSPSLTRASARDVSAHQQAPHE